MYQLPELPWDSPGHSMYYPSHKQEKTYFTCKKQILKCKDKVHFTHRVGFNLIILDQKMSSRNSCTLSGPTLVQKSKNSVNPTACEALACGVVSHFGNENFDQNLSAPIRCVRFVASLVPVSCK